MKMIISLLHPRRRKCHCLAVCRVPYIPLLRPPSDHYRIHGTWLYSYLALQPPPVTHIIIIIIIMLVY